MAAADNDPENGEDHQDGQPDDGSPTRPIDLGKFAAPFGAVHGPDSARWPASRLRCVPSSKRESREIESELSATLDARTPRSRLAAAWEALLRELADA